MAKSGSQLQLEIDDYLARAATEAKSTPSPAPSSSPAVSPAAAKILNAYEARQERKRARLEAAATKAKASSAAAFGRAHQIGEAIPFGQPILVGHHSEGRHRRDVAKIERSMRKGVEEGKRAEELERRAEAVGTAGISSDDPEAVRKLKVELEGLRRDQERMKAGNAAIRKHAKAGPEAQVAALMALGFSEKLSRSALEKDFAGRIGFPAYAITNNGANIRRIEKRIAELTARETAPAREPLTGTYRWRGPIEPTGGAAELAIEWELRENKDLNRTQIVFPGQPPKELRERLKAGGFKWAPTEGAWQRQLSNGAWHHAQRALGVG